ncbi:unnamed protein product [marine sediment metagenome]|uniref:Uncharacterized protein n=1 Tax=marine sediment metagenome TaxID=412755 RepID=X1R096_9ZZZZ
MTGHLIATEVSKYPNYLQAKAYLRNFLRHGRRAFLRTKRYAYYQHSPTLRVIVIYVSKNILEVRAYPVDGFLFATIEEAVRAEDFRGWLFTYDYRNRSIYYITGSQRVGIDNYRQVKRAIQKERELARASQAYLAL